MTYNFSGLTVRAKAQTQTEEEKACAEGVSGGIGYFQWLDSEDKLLRHESPEAP